jgi:cyclic pyranopterin phosphate synthase
MMFYISKKYVKYSNYYEEGTNLRHYIRSGIQNEQLQFIILNIWAQRYDRYSEERGKRTGQNRKRQKIEMSYIGG